MIVLYIVCAVALIASVIASPKKTKTALKAASKLLFSALPTFLGIIILMVIFLYFVPPTQIVDLLSMSGNVVNILMASLVGSLVVIPGFIAFPVAGILSDIGVGYGVLAAFTTTLMMVGILTFPLEKKYFGTKFALYRNISSYLIALVVSVVMAVVLGGGA